MKLDQLMAEFARRYVQFHDGMIWTNIHCWLSSTPGVMLRFKEREWVVPEDKERIGFKSWYKPTHKAWTQKIEPLTKKSIDELERLSGWK